MTSFLGKAFGTFALNTCLKERCWRLFAFAHYVRWSQNFKGTKLIQKFRYDNKIKYPLVLFSGILAAPLPIDEKETKSRKEDESQVVLMIKHAILAQMKDESEKAEMYLHKALKLADEEYNQKKLSKIEYLNAKVYVYDTLANNAFIRQDFEKAEVLFKETMRGYVEGGKETKDNAMVEISLKLATIYAMQKRDQEAVQGYEFCINTQKEKLSSSSKDADTLGFLGMALEGYGRYLLYKKQLGQSVVMLTEALDIAKSLLGDQADQTLVIMNDLATVYLLNKDFDKAEQLLRLAIQHGEKSDSEVCATLYSNLGAIYLGRSQLSETETACRKSLELAKLNKDQFAINQANQCLNKLKEERNKMK